MITFDELKLLLEVSIDQLRRDWVESGRMDADIFNFLCQCANNQSAYATWLVKRAGDSPNLMRSLGALANATEETKGEEIRRYQHYFDIFTKQKQHFEIKDINRYTNLGDWLEDVREVEQKLEEKKRQKDVDRFKIGAVEANGKTYLVYKLPKNHPENHPISVELAKTSGGRYGGAGWCTGSPDHINYWNDHIAREDLYIFVNPQDRDKDKFQIQYNYYRDKPFPVTTDQPMGDEQVKPYMPFYKFLHDKEGRPEKPEFVIEAERKAEQERLRQIYVRHAVEHPTRTLEDCKIHDGVYRVISVSQRNIEDWIAPLTTLLGLPDSERINVAQVGSPSYVSYFISTSADGRSNFKAFTPIHYRRRNKISEGSRFVTSNPQAPLTPNVREAINRVGAMTAEDTQNTVLFDRLKWLSEYTGYPLNQDLARTARELSRSRGGIRAARAQANGRDINAIMRQLEEVSDMSFVNSGASFYEITPNDVHILFDGLENMQAEATRLNRFLSGVVGVVVQKGIALLLSDLHNGNEYEDADINHIYNQLIVRIDLATGMVMPNRMNPDALYTIYKSFKRGDNEVTYPPMIASIDAIHNGSLDEYELDWRPTGVTKLYKVPVAQRSLIPYSLPEVMYQNGDIYLGFISKWQFTLSNNGSFMLTGRWGSAGSKSWINSVPGLADALIAICDRYNIPRGGALRQLQEMCDECNVEYPARLREALMQESMQDLKEYNQSCKDLWLDYILG